MESRLPKIDGHCHLFNLWYLISELLAMAYEATREDYPRRGTRLIGTRPTVARARQADLLVTIRVLIKQIAELGRSMFEDFEENYRLLKSSFDSVFGEEELAVIPLMMDIYYMFDGYFDGEIELEADAPRPLKNAPSSAAKMFDSWLHETQSALETTFASLLAEGAGAKTLLAPYLGPMAREFDNLRGKVLERWNGIPSLAYGPRPIPGLVTCMSPGYEKEIRDSIALRDKYPGLAFPFLAVDPRRGGIMELVKGYDVFTGKNRPLVSRSGPFYGIKLYPRLGYTPQDIADGTDLFDWCAMGDIPITVHCSTGGFPNLPDWKWAANSDPRLWEETLKTYRRKYGGLRVDFAHFGRGDMEWRKAIIDYATNKDGAYGDKVFSDISCFVGRGSLEEAKIAYDENSGLHGKLLFGTDYDVMLLTAVIDLESYFRQYLSVFSSPCEIEDMMVRAPRHFLNAIG